MTPPRKLTKYLPRILRDDGMVTLTEVAHYDVTHQLTAYYRADDVDAAQRDMSYRVIKILTNNDGEVLGEGREITGEDNKYGTKPLFELRHQHLVPLEDVKNLETRLHKLEEALAVTAKWMRWWLDLRDCDCSHEGGSGHSCGLRERLAELEQAEAVLTPPTEVHS